MEFWSLFGGTWTRCLWMPRSDYGQGGLFSARSSGRSALLLRDQPSERRRLVLIILAITIVSVGHIVHLLLR